MLGAPENRVRTCCNAPVAADGDYVVYWMMAARRTGWNYGLQQAVHYAQELGRPLVVFEAIRCGYRWASDRFHQFVLEGMRDRAQWFAGRPVTYVPYVEPREGAGRGLLEHLAGRACVVVTDDYPAFFLPRAVSAVASRLKVRLEAVDSNGIFPMRATERVFTTAYSFRSFLQKELPARLDEWPSADPLADVPLPRLGADPLVNTEWRAHDVSAPIASVIAGLPIDHGVGGVAI
ncbi:MAG: deoxyribodipyrimidine photolyase, partial [Nannocystaceae bacterium]